jgi:YbgC/YbaW family acyl-CoA thioester hydrolase
MEIVHREITIIDVRFTDIDSQNHVNHCSIVNWIAHCRVRMIDDIVTESDINDINDIDHVLVHASFNFAEEIIYPSSVIIKGYITEVGNTSVKTRYLVHVGDTLVADAECINVFVSTIHKGSVSIPAGLQKLLEGET